MASYGNMKLPPNLDKPPLFNSGYRMGGSEPNKSMNFSSLPGLARINDFKVPKSEPFFTSDLDPPSFKRTKFADESHQPQVCFTLLVSASKGCLVIIFCGFDFGCCHNSSQLHTTGIHCTLTYVQLGVLASVSLHFVC